jgi:tRNA splicing ligase
MLATQQYLKSKSFDELTAELGVTVKRHESLPLAILNYDQIESPKTHPVIRECRGLVLHADTHEIVAKSFNRFFNWGEVADEMSSFDFSDFVVQSKEDGSLVLLYHFEGEWHANTRNSFALDKIEFQNFSWRDAFCKALGISSMSELKGKLDTRYTYVCEFCSPWNKIVRRYEKPTMYLLAMFEGSRELTWDELRQQEHLLGLVQHVNHYEFKSVEEIQAFLQQQGRDDPTFEGVVIRDRHGHRWKIKSATYLGFHRLRGEGDNLYNPKHLLPFIMAGEEDELLTYFSEVSETFYKLKSKVQGYYIDLLETWADHRHIQDQKEFALKVKDKKFASVLFNVRKKYGVNQTSTHIKQEWREAEATILKHLKF